MSAVVRLIDELPELAEHLPPEQADAARERAVARVARYRPAAWPADVEYANRFSWLGLLVLDGLVLREIAFGGERSVELLGPGDLLRPWDHDGAYSVPNVEVNFRVLQEANLALLDDEFAARIGQWPALTAALVARAGLRARWLAVRVALSAIPGIATRLLFLFSHLADRFGRVTPEGIVLPLDLTHSLLADLIGARRPSVTTALGELHRRGHVSRRPDGGWLLAPELEELIGASIESDSG